MPVAARGTCDAARTNHCSSQATRHDHRARATAVARHVQDESASAASTSAAIAAGTGRIAASPAGCTDDAVVHELEHVENDDPTSTTAAAGSHATIVRTTGPAARAATDDQRLGLVAPPKSAPASSP